MRCTAAARSPTSPGAESAGRRDRSPAASACATSRSSTTGFDTARENAAARISAATSATRPDEQHVALPARDDRVETRSRDRHARDAELRFHRDVDLVDRPRTGSRDPRSRRLSRSAAMTSGRLLWFSSRVRASPRNSESPTTRPVVIDERDAVTDRGTRARGERIGIDAGGPVARNEPRLARRAAPPRAPASWWRRRTPLRSTNSTMRTVTTSTTPRRSRCASFTRLRADGERSR